MRCSMGNNDRGPRVERRVAVGLVRIQIAKHQVDEELLWGVIVDEESYFQDEPASHGYYSRYPTNETCFAVFRSTTLNDLI